MSAALLDNDDGDDNDDDDDLIDVMGVFPEVFTPKVIVIARLEFELTYSYITVNHISHCITGTPFL